MRNRIKELRLHFNLSQETFGSKLGVTRTAICLLESGRNNITDRMTKEICREFNVREEWLRFGTGDMFETLSKEEQVAALIGNIFTDRESEIYDFRLSVLKKLGELDEKDWKVIKKIIDGIYEE